MKKFVSVVGGIALTLFICSPSPSALSHPVNHDGDSETNFLARSLQVFGAAENFESEGAEERPLSEETSEDTPTSGLSTALPSTGALLFFGSMEQLDYMDDRSLEFMLKGKVAPKDLADYLEIRRTAFDLPEVQTRLMLLQDKGRQFDEFARAQNAFEEVVREEEIEAGQRPIQRDRSHYNTHFRTPYYSAKKKTNPDLPADQRHLTEGQSKLKGLQSEFKGAKLDLHDEIIRDMSRDEIASLKRIENRIENALKKARAETEMRNFRHFARITQKGTSVADMAQFGLKRSGTRALGLIGVGALVWQAWDLLDEPDYLPNQPICVAHNDAIRAINERLNSEDTPEDTEDAPLPERLSDLCENEAQSLN